MNKDKLFRVSYIIRGCIDIYESDNVNANETVSEKLFNNIEDLGIESVEISECMEV